MLPTDQGYRARAQRHDAQLLFDVMSIENVILISLLLRLYELVIFFSERHVPLSSPTPAPTLLCVSVPPVFLHIRNPPNRNLRGSSRSLHDASQSLDLISVLTHPFSPRSTSPGVARTGRRVAGPASGGRRREQHRPQLLLAALPGVAERARTARARPPLRRCGRRDQDEQGKLSLGGARDSVVVHCRERGSNL